MSYQILAGKKIAILVENEYIPEEINAYKERFGVLGASVDFISRLWGQKKQTFLSAINPLDPDAKNKQPETLDVFLDIGDVNVQDYVAVLMAANYTSVRLRYFERPDPQTGLNKDLVRTAPAVKFYAEAMKNPRIVKGALCHGLWILTPNPSLLEKRKVICHEVVLADIVNCGAIYVPPDLDTSGQLDPSGNRGVVVDGDLVTGLSVDSDVLYVYINEIIKLVGNMLENGDQ